MHEYSVSASLGQLLTTSYIFTLGLISAMTAYLVHRVDSEAVHRSHGVLRRRLRGRARRTELSAAVGIAPAASFGGVGIALPLIQVVALSVHPKSEYGRAMGAR